MFNLKGDEMNSKRHEDYKLVTSHMLTQLIAKLNVAIKKLEKVDKPVADEFKEQKEKLSSIFTVLEGQRSVGKRASLRDVFFSGKNVLN